MQIDPKLINKLAKEIHEQNCAVGWWDEENPCLLTKSQLCITEVAEATEGARKDLMDDHLPHRKMEEVELADCLIRVLDLGAHTGSHYFETDTLEQMAPELNANKNNPAGLHFLISAGCIGFGAAFFKTNQQPTDHVMYSALIDTIIYVAELRGFNLFEATKEKFEYNKTRADHKRENRAKDGGKKF